MRDYHFWHAIWTSHLRCRNKLHQFHSIPLALFDILKTLLTDMQRPAVVDVFMWSVMKEVCTSKPIHSHLYNERNDCAHIWGNGKSSYARILVAFGFSCCLSNNEIFVESRSALSETIVNGKLFDATFFAAKNPLPANYILLIKSNRIDWI